MAFHTVPELTIPAALTLGAIVPQTWPNATEGEEIVLGMQLAIKTWPGQPAPTLVVKDSACDPRKADAAARELIAGFALARVQAGSLEPLRALAGA